jgi:hypothetical protein
MTDTFERESTMGYVIKTIYRDFLIYKAKLFGPYYEYMSKAGGRGHTITITNERGINWNSAAWFLFKYGVAK